jgi:2-dehydropantoate 2-reductase
MRILMVGAGATGGFYGGMLLRAGRDVTFLLRPSRAQHIREHGLTILPHEGDAITLHPPVLTAAELPKAAPFDLIILSTKSYQLEAAMADIAPAVGPDTMVMPILNGMRQIEALTTRFGPGHILPGTVRIVSDLDAQGRILQLNPLDEMSYGEISRAHTPRILAVHETMQGAGFTAILQPDILATLWQKWWILASMGAICVLSRGTIGQAAQVPYGPELALAILKECTDVASANGYPPNPAMYAQHKDRFTDPSSTLTSSMYRDMSKGAPVEADHILGDLLTHASGVPVPLITAAYVQLKVYEALRPSA